MGKIFKLDNTLIDKIAAGEVIVRPASVVKELLENSIDAGATRIKVEISNSNRDISITDDGCGMESEDMFLSFERHATSKIKSIEDLEILTTRGFRGEALASIAAVSKIEMVSRVQDSISGFKIQYEGGKLILSEPTGAQNGTMIHVRSLFYNTPARLKFLKSEISEMNAIMQIFVSQALSAHQTGFVLVVNNTVNMELPPNQSLKDRIISIFGSQYKDSLIEIKREAMPVFVNGFISKPEITKKDRQSELFFIQKRPIICKTLNYCVEQAFSGLLMTKRFPFCVLFIELGAGEVDVNVHPTKSEVRFRDERIISSIVYHAVSDALKQACLIPQIELPKTNDPFQDIISKNETPTGQGKSVLGTDPAYSQDIFRNPEVLTKKSFSPGNISYQRDLVQLANKTDEKNSSDDSDIINMKSLSSSVHPEPLPESFYSRQTKGTDSPEVILENIWSNDLVPEPIGQVANTYIVSVIEDNLLFIDQHAAHERILYNLFKDKKSSLQKSSQNLLIPINIEVKLSNIPQMNLILPYLKEIGFDIMHFGGATYSIQSLPLYIKENQCSLLIQDILDDLAEQKDKTEIDIIKDKIITRAACRAAIKSGDVLNIDEMRSILSELKRMKLSFTCPHGRPTMILLSKNQLDKQFKRIV